MNTEEVIGGLAEIIDSMNTGRKLSIEETRLAKKSLIDAILLLKTEYPDGKDAES